MGHVGTARDRSGWGGVGGERVLLMEMCEVHSITGTAVGVCRWLLELQKQRLCLKSELQCRQFVFNFVTGSYTGTYCWVANPYMHARPSVVILNVCQ